MGGNHGQCSNRLFIHLSSHALIYLAEQCVGHAAAATSTTWARQRPCCWPTVDVSGSSGGYRCKIKRTPVLFLLQSVRISAVTKTCCVKYVSNKTDPNWEKKNWHFLLQVKEQDKVTVTQRSPSIYKDNCFLPSSLRNAVSLPYYILSLEQIVSI